MSSIIEYIKRNKKFILLAICLVYGAIAMLPLTQVVYYSGILYLIFVSIKNKGKNNRLGIYYILFLMTCFISSCLAFVLDYRLFAFIALIVACTPITHSLYLYVFREKYLYHCLMIFPILSVASIFGYFAGINYIGEVTKHTNELDFSGFFPHPLWLAAALGIGNIVLTWLIFSVKSKTYKVIYVVVLLFSIYLSVIAASRAAFFASMISMVVLIFIRLHNLKKILIASTFITLFTLAVLPIYLSGAERMQNKFETSRGEYGSRTDLFNRAKDNFKRDPIFGQGFAVSYDETGERTVGRMETGSGWISILSQTGLVGFIIAIILLLQVRRVVPYLKKDNKLVLYFSSFLYLSLHSLFEGYLLTVGYYPCVLFWTLLGFLHVYPYYRRIEKNYVEWKSQKNHYLKE